MITLEIDTIHEHPHNTKAYPFISTQVYNSTEKLSPSLKIYSSFTAKEHLSSSEIYFILLYYGYL